VRTIKTTRKGRDCMIYKFRCRECLHYWDEQRVMGDCRSRMCPDCQSPDTYKIIEGTSYSFGKNWTLHDIEDREDRD